MIPAADTAVSSRFYGGQKRRQSLPHPLCGAIWCGVGAPRGDTMRGEPQAGPMDRIERIESTNHIGSHGRAHLPNRIFTAHTNLPVFYHFTVPHPLGPMDRIERIEPTNHIGSHGRVHLSNRIFTAHTNLPVFYYFTVLMFIGFGKIKQTQQIVRSGSLSSSLLAGSMTAT